MYLIFSNIKCFLQISVFKKKCPQKFIRKNSLANDGLVSNSLHIYRSPRLSPLPLSPLDRQFLIWVTTAQKPVYLLDYMDRIWFFICLTRKHIWTILTIFKTNIRGHKHRLRYNRGPKPNIPEPDRNRINSKAVALRIINNRNMKLNT